jgi:8-oxo-dGTP pyrophosphatase MutT (NUDIX family)
VAHEDFLGELKLLRKRYGVPRRVHFTIDMNPEEYELVAHSVRHGRRHDVTIFICHEGKFAVIQKHAYARTGVFRAPSGGALPGEALAAAAKREAREETGLEIELDRFVLEVHANLRCEGKPSVDWSSYVFLAHSVGGQLDPQDTHEIFEAQLRTRADLLNDIRPLMLASGSGGFRYRALMTDAFFAQLDALGIST